MTFALTSFVADGIRFQGPTPYRSKQQYVFTVTAAASDVDLDIGDTTGTFWSAAQADSTYGEMATQVLDNIEAWAANLQAVSNLYTPELAGFTQVLSLSVTGTYTLALDSTTKLPNYTFHTDGGATAYTVFVEYLLDPNMLPNAVSYNVA